MLYREIIKKCLFFVLKMEMGILLIVLHIRRFFHGGQNFLNFLADRVQNPCASRILCMMSFLNFSHFQPQKAVPQRTCKNPLNPLQHKGLRGFFASSSHLACFEIFSYTNLFSLGLWQRENFWPYFEEKYTWHCLLWRRHFKIEQQKFFLNKTVKTCSICPIIAQKTSVSISAAFSTWENMTFRGKIFYTHEIADFEPEMPKTRTNAAKKFSAKGAVTSRQ